MLGLADLESSQVNRFLFQNNNTIYK